MHRHDRILWSYILYYRHSLSKTIRYPIWWTPLMLMPSLHFSVQTHGFIATKCSIIICHLSLFWYGTTWTTTFSVAVTITLLHTFLLAWQCLGLFIYVLVMQSGVQCDLCLVEKMGGYPIMGNLTHALPTVENFVVWILVTFFFLFHGWHILITSFYKL